MPKRPKKSELMSTAAIAATLEVEGLGYLVLDYISPESVEDPELRAWFVVGRAALQQIERRLREVE